MLYNSFYVGLCSQSTTLAANLLAQVEGLIARASVCQSFADMHFRKLGAENAFSAELFVMHEVDADGAIQSELSETDAWAGKVKAVTDAVSKEVDVLKAAQERQSDILAQLQQQGNETQEKLDKTQAKLDQLISAVALLAKNPSARD